MARDWEATFARWATPPSETQQEKAENAARAIRAAIGASKVLSEKQVTVFAQGSYRNRTNVRADSDVDVAVLCSDTFYFQLPSGATPEQLGLSTPATYRFAQFRADVQAALVAHFGAESVRAGTKALDVHANTYRIDADVLPCFEYRCYNTGMPPTHGTAFISGSQRIENFPQQHYDNGVARNERTSRRYKANARILKSLRYEMVDADIALAKPMASFLLESLVWNVPDGWFDQDTYSGNFRRVLAYLITEPQQISLM